MQVSTPVSVSVRERSDQIAYVLLLYDRELIDIVRTQCGQRVQRIVLRMCDLDPLRSRHDVLHACFSPFRAIELPHIRKSYHARKSVSLHDWKHTLRAA
jgi:hypothetical protein